MPGNVMVTCHEAWLAVSLCRRTEVCRGRARQEEGILTFVHTACCTPGLPWLPGLPGLPELPELPELPTTWLAREDLCGGLTAQCLRSPTHWSRGHLWWRRRTDLAVRGTTMGESPVPGLEMTSLRRRSRGFLLRISSRQLSVRAGVPVTWQGEIQYRERTGK